MSIRYPRQAPYLNLPQPYGGERTAIFYLSYEAGPNRTPFALPTGDVVFIRAEVSRGDLSEALCGALPQQGEHVMNTHWMTAALAAADKDE